MNANKLEPHPTGNFSEPKLSNKALPNKGKQPALMLLKNALDENTEAKYSTLKLEAM